MLFWFSFNLVLCHVKYIQSVLQNIMMTANVQGRSCTYVHDVSSFEISGQGRVEFCRIHKASITHLISHKVLGLALLQAAIMYEMSECKQPNPDLQSTTIIIVVV